MMLNPQEQEYYEKVIKKSILNGLEDIETAIYIFKLRLEDVGRLIQSEEITLEAKTQLNDIIKPIEANLKILNEHINKLLGVREND